ncbi:VOC family protein [Alicyclobacillus tolerans]|uniref:Enzyme related to lactoylglutathione lyase n=1 Tax=Alicyclobacillus tolerans TaxID=90970 RepID=A0ABT9LU79_9BACL|nr:VOC family protein [Alicyclobacillus tengchongensis]MDP9727817.1 putative enzyme related to lactoylglutathione lyase [Alicyclobacillus tengchongensis]
MIGEISSIILLTNDVESLAEFYHRVLGFELNSMVSTKDYKELDGESIAISIAAAQSEVVAGSSLAIGIDVKNMPKAIAALEKAGVEITHQTDGPYVSIRSFRDPAGNLVSLIERHY